VHLCLYAHYTHTSSPYLPTLSLHDALPISVQRILSRLPHRLSGGRRVLVRRQSSRRLRSDHRSASPERFALHLLQQVAAAHQGRSEEHTSELQSLTNLVCRLLLEKKKNQNL